MINKTKIASGGKVKATGNLKTARLPLMMTAESVLSKHPVLRFTVALLFLLETSVILQQLSKQSSEPD